jgi:hypothetical protein
MLLFRSLVSLPESAIASFVEFDPATSDYLFRLGMDDYIIVRIHVDDSQAIVRD